MLSNSDAAKALRTHFKKHLVATLPELVEVLRNPSRSSVYRRLKTLGYLASYTHAGAHYTLSEIPDFDEAGLWWHQGIGFSKCGNLKDTIAAWVGHSAAGYTLNELEAPLKLRVQNAPLALVREGTITRNAFDGVYVYLSGDPVRAEEQMAARHQFRAIRTGGALPGELVIDVLATAIRGHQWELDHAAITQALRSRGRYVTRAQVDQVLTALAGRKRCLLPDRGTATGDPATNRDLCPPQSVSRPPGVRLSAEGGLLRLWRRAEAIQDRKTHGGNPSHRHVPCAPQVPGLWPLQAGGQARRTRPPRCAALQVRF